MSRHTHWNTRLFFNDVYDNGTMIEAWIAIVLYWESPVRRVIDKEFTSVNECWNHYEEGQRGEDMFGTQNLDTQGNRPKIDYHFARDGVAIRTYKGKDGLVAVWLSCERR